MKKFRLSKKLLIWIGSGICSFVVFLAFRACITGMIHSQDTQQMAKRWSDKKNVAQISAFFSQNVAVNQDTIVALEHQMDTVLQEAGIFSEAENPDARLWADAYSARGQISIYNDYGSVSCEALGVGGDFFYFHPLKLVNGSYFSGNDVNKDYCIIDEETAWQLFGSNDVVGMTVYTGQTPLLITGVIERPKGKLEAAAGLKNSIVYVSYEMLGAASGMSEKNMTVNHYEIVMPNVFNGFALEKVKELLAIEESAMEVVQNTGRYSILNSLKRVAAFGTRSMNGKAILYPYWENLARGYEDIITVLTVLMLLSVIYPLGMLLIIAVIWWRNKGWTIKSLFVKLWKFLSCMKEKKKHRLTVDDLYEDLQSREEEL